jgi:hypothetical protein
VRALGFLDCLVLFRSCFFRFSFVFVLISQFDLRLRFFVLFLRLSPLPPRYRNHTFGLSFHSSLTPSNLLFLTLNFSLPSLNHKQTNLSLFLLPIYSSCTRTGRLRLISGRNDRRMMVLVQIVPQTRANILSPPNNTPTSISTS